MIKYAPSLFLKDTVEISRILFEILEYQKGSIYDFASVYDTYRSLDRLLHKAEDKFINGIFSKDISVFEGTEFFESPLKKWVYFSNQDIKSVNNALCEYWRGLYGIFYMNKGLSESLSTEQFKANMRLVLRCAVPNSDEGKINISADGMNLRYEYYQYVYESGSSYRVPEEEFLQEISFDISTPNQKNQIRENAKNALDELQAYKERFERLMLEYCTVKSFFVKNVKDT